MDTINESTTAFQTITFLNENGVPIVPTAATYRLDDEASEHVIKADTTISGLASSVTITLSTTDNAIVNATEKYDVHVLTVEWDYTGSHGATHGADFKRFKVINLLGVA